MAKLKAKFHIEYYDDDAFQAWVEIGPAGERLIFKELLKIEGELLKQLSHSMNYCDPDIEGSKVFPSTIPPGAIPEMGVDGGDNPDEDDNENNYFCDECKDWYEIGCICGCYR